MPKIITQKNPLTKKRCPFCHAEMEIPHHIGAEGYCRCGAYGQIHLLGDTHPFLERARRALGVEADCRGRRIEVIDGGTVFEEGTEPAIIQWAKKPEWV
jgi:hypothetical protein